MNAVMQQVLGKINTLISKRGFVYALIMAQIEDETIPASILENRNVQDRLSCNEIIFLWSLLVNKDDFWQYPDSLDELYAMRCEIPQLMEELHFTFFEGLTKYSRESVGRPYYDGASFQEAIFYSGGALYDEEYIPYIKTRFADDCQWLKEEKGYNKDSFCDIVCRIKDKIAEKVSRFSLLALPETLNQRLADKPRELTEEEYKKVLVLGQFLYDQDDNPTLQEYCDRMKDAVSFKIEDLKGCSDVEDYLELFSIEPSQDCNNEFKEPGDYSILMSRPIIRTPDGYYLNTEIHQLFKSLYDVPRYWLNERLDKHGKTGTRIGDFSEKQTLKVLKGLFGENCYSDIIIYKGKQQLTDIDVLCIWKDYSLCFQIKSKGLTLSSRQGNFSAIEADFRKSFQAAYKQGLKCREALLSKTGYSYVDRETGQKLTLPTLREVYIICETSDEYPSLTHQMAILLHRNESEPAALAVNLFDIDLMGKYLNEPYYFVHYVHNRLKYYNSTRTDVETNCLYAYTHNRLVLSGEIYDTYMFDNSFAKAIDAELMPKYAKHEEITVNNSIWRDAVFDNLIKEIGSSGNSEVSQVILKLLDFGKDEVKQIGLSIIELIKKGRAGTQEYVCFLKGGFGFAFIVMELGSQEEIHEHMKELSINEIKAHQVQNWLTIAHFLGSNKLVGTLAYICGR